MSHANHPPQPWDEADIDRWRASLQRQRSYRDDVLEPVRRLVDRSRGRLQLVNYGEVRYPLRGEPGEAYPLLAVRAGAWTPGRPGILVTGGVHGYETSGVLGALAVAAEHLAHWAGRANLVVAPCVSPWAYERVHRWNFDAVDPNRTFTPGSAVQESAALMRLVAAQAGAFVAHVDLHETTDTDETVFRPALAARDGKVFEPGSVPDGFYLVDDAENPQPDFQRAIIEAVARVTHIAPADSQSKIIGCPVVDAGVIRYPVKALGLCAGVTGGRWTTTTEMYPDSPRVDAAQCVAAQVTAVRAAVEHVLAST